MERGRHAPRHAPGRFRCLPCRRVVIGTESGHCPNCGFVPPTAPEIPLVEGRGTSVIVLLVLIAVFVAVLVFVTD